jgi:hypothetical protein
MRGVFQSTMQRSGKDCSAGKSKSPNKMAPAKQRKATAKQQSAKARSPKQEVDQQQQQQQWLQQRSAEVDFTLRMDIHSNSDLEAAHTTVSSICSFLDDVEACAKKADVTSEVVFQELLARLCGEQDFDSQHGTTGVPMHQAKVLSRKRRLIDAQIGTALEAIVGPDGLKAMVSHVNDMRRLLKIKVEDKNDLRMATAAVKDAQAFFMALQACSQAQNCDLFTLWRKLSE